MLASVYVCRPWCEMIADHAGAGGPTRGIPSSSMLGTRRGLVLDNGNVGFQLIGGDGGGIYLVRRAGVTLKTEHPGNSGWNLVHGWFSFPFERPPIHSRGLPGF